MTLLQTGTNPANLPFPFLGYSLLIILVCAAALVKVYRKWQKGRYTQGFRAIQGLIILIALRLISFILTYYFWQKDPTFTPGLLVMDQAASLIGIIIIFWLWNFPEPSREADPIFLAIIILLSALVVTQTIFVPNLLDGITGSLSFWEGLSITALVINLGLILIRKPNLWRYGLFMGILLAIGSTLSLFSNSLDSLHLAQLSAYPLLLLLSDRFPIGDTPSSTQTLNEDKLLLRRVSVEHDILTLIQRLFDEKDPDGILYKIAQVTAYLILADLALIIDTPDRHGKIRIIAGYDLIREEPMQALTLDSKSIPLLSNYIQRGKMLHIPASSTSRDLSHLANMLQLSKPGHLLAAPVHISGANKTIGVVLFSPFSNRPWTKEDQDYIKILCKLFEAAFSHHLVSQDSESESVKGTIRELSSKLTRLNQDKQGLKEEMAVLSRNHQNLLLDQDALEAKHNQLMTWGNSLQRHLTMLINLSEKESTEALRKYISVIDKEIQDIKDHKPPPEVVEKIVSPQTTSAKTADPDPDSIRPAELQEAISSCLENAKSEIEEKELITKVELPDDIPLLEMNHALFQEIFSFLVANAILENDTGGEVIIQTQLYEEDKTQHFAHIKISDQGQGYFPDEIAAVLNEHLTKEQQGELSQVMTNLFVTKNLVENEGGRMWVESKPGEGTTVSLLLAFL